MRNFRLYSLSGLLLMTALLLGLFLFMPGTASAEADLVKGSPDFNGHARVMPDRVIIDTSEKLNPQESSIRVYGPGGALINTGELQVIPERQSSMLVLIKDSGPGTYIVQWKSVSAVDGKAVEGAYTFTVGDQNNFPLITTMITGIVTLVIGIIIGASIRRSRPVNNPIEDDNQVSVENVPAETNR